MSQVQQSVLFRAPRSVVIESAPCPAPGPAQVRIRTEYSAISAGSELLFYRGLAPADLAVDSAIGALAGQASAYPIRYGYACVGIIEAIGPDVAAEWLGRRVFAFHPHSSHFLASPDELIPVPEGIAPTHAALLPNMETAVNFVMDGNPVIGERVAVFGLGIVGLLTTALLARFPLEGLWAIDPLSVRRTAAERLGASRTLAPGTEWRDDCDLCYELTGNPDVLNDAIGVTGYGGRIVIGSWYGDKQAPLRLGGAFHRSRIRLLSSQVSTIDPRWLGRWSKERRFDVAWRMLGELPLEGLITHKIPVTAASEAYRMLDAGEDGIIQILLTYDQSNDGVK
jgi:2-desacetyl-2-hydroxyethyl bacteriochlorophyllide A dehydrogenase